MYSLAQIRKAVVGGAGAALFAGVAALGSALTDDGVLTAPEVGTAAGAALAAFAVVGGAVFKVRNAD